jgi:glycosyltransferase involved in cell wall biosynthesis
MKALLIAELANPETVSVPLEGWSHAMAIRRLCDALVVTQIRHREVFLRHGLVEGTDFLAIDSEAVARPAWRLGQLLRGGGGKGWTTAMAVKLPGYLYFERLLWKQLGHRIKGGEFDLVHRLTPLSPTLPSPIARRCRAAKVPFIIGPLNGGVPWPKGYNEARVKEREWLSFVRDAYRVVPGFKATRRNAAGIIAGSLDTLEREPPAYRNKMFYVPENGIDPSRFTARRTPRSVDMVRIVFVGRLVPYKGCDILIEAAADLLASGRATLTIVGDGPQRAELERFVRTHDVSHAVEFRGWVKHEHVGPIVADADVFAFPSIREFGGAVAIEAMAAGVPPMVVSYGGLAETVTEEVGFPVPIGRRDQLVARFRDRLSELLTDPESSNRKGAAGLERIEHFFTWDAKASQVMKIYQEVLGGSRCDRSQVPLPSPAQRRFESILGS